MQEICIKYFVDAGTFILPGCQKHVVWHFEVLLAVTVKIAVYIET
jgi:hypothetical protein